MQPAPAGGDQVIVSTLRHVHDRQPDTAYLLGALGRLWQGGVEIDWAGFYTQERRQRLSLPLYSFDRQRYWIDFDRDGFVRRPTKGKKEDVGSWFYLPGWKASLPPGGRGLRGGMLDERGPWLVFVNGCELGRQLLGRLREEAGEVVTVRLGERWVRLADDEYEINLQRPEDYQQLLADLYRPPATVVHLWALGATEPEAAAQDRFDTCQELGLYSLLSLARAADRYAVEQPIEVVVLASGLSSVTGDEPLYPEKATLLAACNTVPQEFPGLSLRSVDLTLPVPGSRQEFLLLDRLLGELASGSTDRAVAYRGDTRWVRTYEPVQLPPVDSTTTKLRPGGVYLITGGLGSVGLILAEHLARNFQAKLVLTSRTPVPKREDWPAWLDKHGNGSAQAAKIQQLLAFEELGAEVLVVQADAAQVPQMQQAVNAAQERFGTLHGVIHAAGVSGGEGFGLLQDIGRHECELHFQPKVRGLLALDKALEGLSLDFCLLMSSLSSVLGGITLGAYGAANLFMDAFLELHNRGEGTPWLAINWDTWHTRQGQHEIIGKTVAEFEMSPAEGCEAFERAVSQAGVGRLVNSSGDLEARIDQWIRLRALQTGGEAGPSQRRHDRPTLVTPFVAPATPREQTIAELWQELLGIGTVGRYDNFFELGGHSLLGIQLFARLREAFQVELPLRSLFETPTVAGQAEVVETLRWMSETEPAMLPTGTVVVEGEL
jgi:NAD(P)-dependent dehydrogenase (short-subunit alcohol dehydrogenase family)